MKTNKRQQAAYPNRKISETFLDFASPLTAVMPDDASEATIQKVLTIAFVAWNGIILDDVNGNGYYMARLKEQASHDPVLQALLTELVHRKRTLFADDQRLIGNYRVTRKRGELRPWAEARDPYPLPQTKGLGRKSGQASLGAVAMSPHLTASRHNPTRPKRPDLNAWGWSLGLP